MVGRFYLRMLAVLAPLLLLAAPAGASAARSVSFMTIGPIRVDNHYTLQIDAAACNGKHPSVQVVFDKTFRGGGESHNYSSTSRQQCHVAANASTASLKTRLGEGMANIDVTFHKKGRARHGVLAPGCTGTKPLTQPGVVTGRFQVSIDSAFFGRIRLHRVSASITRFSFNIHCKPQPSSHRALILFAQIGRPRSGSSLAAFRAPGVGAGLSVSTTSNQPSAGVTATHSISVGGRGFVFAAAGNLDSARIDAPSGPIQGHVRFEATPGSTGSNRSGTLSGTLKLHFDVIGARRLKVSGATHVLLARGAGVAVIGKSGSSSGSFTGNFFGAPRFP
jgi:hypothetical protein